MSFTSAGVRVWDPTEQASIHGASAAQGDSLNSRIVSTFATGALRTAAFAGLTSAQKAGIICYVADRQGHSYWDVVKNNWQWMSVHRVLMNGVRDSNADTTNSVSIINMSSVTLPPGNRLIQVSCSTIVTGLSDTFDAYPRITVSGTGISGNNAIAQVFLPRGSGRQVTLDKSWVFTLNGNCDIDMRGQDGSSSQPNMIRFSASRLDIIDLGPTDD